MLKEYNLNTEDEQVQIHFRRTLAEKNFVNIYGPINPHITTEFFERKCLFSPDGICAMMTCECHEQEIEELGDFDRIQQNEWFTGICMNCNSEIRKKNEAFRIPLRDGGFKDCLCSSECAHEQFNFEPEAEEHILIEIMKIYIDAYGIFEEQENEENEEDEDEEI